MHLPTLFHQWQIRLYQTTHITCITLSVLSVMIFYFLWRKKSPKLNLPPSPPKLPLVGNLHQIGRVLHRSLHKLSQKHGPIILLRLAAAPYLVVSSAEIAKEIMKNCESFPDRPQTRAAKALFSDCTNIVFCPLGDYWRQAKKICVVELLSQKRVQSFRFAREEEVRFMTDKICCLCRDGNNEVVDFARLFNAVSSNIVSRSAFGRVYERQNRDKSFRELVNKATDLIGAICFQDLIPSLGWLDVITGFTNELDRTSHEISAFLDQVIEEHKVSSDCNEKSDKKDIVDILLDLQRDGMLDPILTQDNIKAILLDMFSGGTETTSSTMLWLMAELVKNPRIMKKAQEEVRRVLGKKPKIDEDHDLKQMDYLKCIIKETLRLHPFFITRKTNSTVKFDGYDIPAETVVLINSFAIQRDPSLWNNPEDFLPERFLNSSVDFKGQDSKFITFGAGKRSCPGVAYAMVEVEYVVANLLYWFDWELPDGLTPEELDMSETYTTGIRKSATLCLVPKLYSF